MAESPYTKLTREVLAEREVGKTQIARLMSVVFVAAFLLTIISVPLVQQVLEIRSGYSERGRWVWPKSIRPFGPSAPSVVCLVESRKRWAS